MKLWQTSGQITKLERQKEFELTVNDQLICVYVADFTYEQDGKLVAEDVKSKMTRKLPVYAIKRKMMKAIHNIEIRET